MGERILDMDKVAVKAFLSSLAAIGMLFVFMFCALCALFPSTMMELTYNMGMEASAIRFAERAYKDNDEIYFIAYATEVALEESKNDKIVSCGERFIFDDEFDEYCQIKGGHYREFIIGRVCVEKYKEGDKQGAVSLAYETLNGVFSEGNAMVALLFEVKKNNDAETLLVMKTKIEEINLTDLERAYLEKVYAVIGG